MSEIFSEQSEKDIKLQKIALLEKKLALEEGLPHLYGQKMYKWGRKFYESRNRITLLCAANQIGKSSAQIRKVIHWATAPHLWTELWQTRPVQFWYLYPSKDVTTIEFETKWEPLLPQGKFKDHPTIGWHAEYRDNNIYAIFFNSGVRMYFKTYGQSRKTLQTGTVHAMFCFTKGHLLLTNRGLVPIEDIRLGDRVLGQKGWNSVLKKHAPRLAPVITRTFKSGAKLTATPDHPFFVQGRGWVPFGELTERDVCLTVPGWKLIKKLFYLKEAFSSVCLRALTQGSKTILGMREAVSFMWSYGKEIQVDGFQRLASSTTKTLTPWIIESETCSSSHEPSTRSSTKLKSGSQKVNTPSFVIIAKRVSLAEVVRERLQGIAPRNAVKVCIEKMTSVLCASLGSILEKIPSKDSVLKSAPMDQEAEVYNIEVSGSHSYFCEGFLTHNCDEELPEDIFDELMFRLAATAGYFHMVFTATLGQQLWWDAIEERGDNEKFPDACKQQVSMYDCLEYEDGSATPWTEDKIKEVIKNCKSDAEIQKRVYGRFVSDEGLLYPTYNPREHFKPGHPVPPNWRVYPGIDMGGGGSGHPAAIVFVAVDPLYQRGRVYTCWRGDGVTTTAGDVVNKFLLMKTFREAMPPRYDFAAKDLLTISSRMGLAFLPADKNHERGEMILNTLFKQGMLHIYDSDDGQKLSNELISLRKDANKRKARDDLVDALRYAVSSIPWDWSVVSDSLPFSQEEKVKTDIDLRREAFLSNGNDMASVEDEMDAWNEMYGAEDGV